MSTLVPLAALPALSSGQGVFLAIMSAMALVSALAVAFSRKAVHAAVYMMSMMVAISAIYFGVGAEFLGAVQIVVYTGAIMMLFLFVIMLVGVQAIDSPRESKVVTVACAVALAIAFAILAIVGAARTTGFAGGAIQGEGSNPVKIATALINHFYVPMEMVAGLLIIAAVGAMTLTHSDQLLPRLTQPFIVKKRMEAYKDGAHVLGQQVPPGVYAETNALDVPAISGETGRPVEESVPRVVRVRDEARTLGETSAWGARALARQASGGIGLHGAEASRAVANSQAWGMPGDPAPDLDAITASATETETATLEPRDGETQTTKEGSKE